MMNRRSIIIGLSASALGLNVPSFAFARDAVFGKTLRSDEGEDIETRRLPSEIPLDPPGVISVGAKSPDVTLIEFFDYNCPWCKKSVGDIEALLAGDSGLRLTLVQNPILSLGSVQVAKVALAVAEIAGPDRAYAFHKAMLSHHGQVAGQDALAEVERMKLDLKKIEDIADSEAQRAALKRQVRTAKELGLDATPSFAVDGMGLLGWPGAKTLAAVVRNVRACDKITC